MAVLLAEAWWHAASQQSDRFGPRKSVAASCCRGIRHETRPDCMATTCELRAGAGVATPTALRPSTRPPPTNRSPRTLLRPFPNRSSLSLKLATSFPSSKKKKKNARSSTFLCFFNFNRDLNNGEKILEETSDALENRVGNTYCSALKHWIDVRSLTFRSVRSDDGVSPFFLARLWH